MRACVCVYTRVCVRAHALPVKTRSLLLVRWLLHVYFVHGHCSSGNHSTSVKWGGGTCSLEQLVPSLEDIRGTTASLQDFCRLSGDPVSLDGGQAGPEGSVQQHTCARICECASVTLTSLAVTGAQCPITASAARSGSDVAALLKSETKASL